MTFVSQLIFCLYPWSGFISTFNWPLSNNIYIILWFVHIKTDSMDDRGWQARSRHYCHWWSGTISVTKFWSGHQVAPKVSVQSCPVEMCQRSATFHVRVDHFYYPRLYYFDVAPVPWHHDTMRHFFVAL